MDNISLILTCQKKRAAFISFRSELQAIIWWIGHCTTKRRDTESKASVGNQFLFLSLQYQVKNEPCSPSNALLSAMGKLSYSFFLYSCCRCSWKQRLVQCGWNETVCKSLLPFFLDFISQCLTWEPRHSQGSLSSSRDRWHLFFSIQCRWQDLSSYLIHDQCFSWRIHSYSVRVVSIYHITAWNMHLD